MAAKRQYPLENTITSNGVRRECSICGSFSINNNEIVCDCEREHNKRIFDLQEIILFEVKKALHLNSIQVWPWQNAPERLKELSTRGGDEDWIVYIPIHTWKEQLLEVTPNWIEAMDVMREPNEYIFEFGVVYITGH